MGFLSLITNGWFIMATIVIALLVLFFCMGYVKAPPNKAYIITGIGKRRILIGKAGIRIPFLERIDKLELGVISVDVKTQVPVPTREFINVKIDGVVTMQVSCAEVEIDGEKVNLMDIAAKNFLNRDVKFFTQMVTPVLEGNAREIIGQMGIQEMVTDRKAFGEKVRENAIPDLRRMGIELLTFNVQNFTDDQGVIVALGTENEVRVKQAAAIARAESEREVKKAQAVAREESRAAEVAAEKNIEERENELRIRKAELQKASDIKKAEADAAYGIQQQEQRRTVEIATVNADIARREREADLAEREIAIRERKLDAEIKKAADAEKYKAEREAEAELVRRQREADAQQYEELKKAEAIKAHAEAELIRAQREAEGISAKGIAEAEAIRAKGIAEAEAIDKKAQAMQKYGEAAVLEMAFAALPEVAKAVAAPLGNVESITMYGEGNSAKLMQEVFTNTNQVLGGIKQGTGVDIAQLLTAFMTGKNTGRIQAIEESLPSGSENVQKGNESDDVDD